MAWITPRRKSEISGVRRHFLHMQRFLPMNEAEERGEDNARHPK
jgi:hypothetical protein